MVVTQDYTSAPDGPPQDGWVESCPRCGRSGMRESRDDGAELIVHSESSELLSDGMLVEPSDCCYL